MTGVERLRIPIELAVCHCTLHVLATTTNNNSVNTVDVIVVFFVNVRLFLAII